MRCKLSSVAPASRTSVGSPERAERPARLPLSRDRVLEEALRLVDEQGLPALTMRALAARLGVEAMSLYGHVDGKDGLRRGIAELLWAEVERGFDAAAGWRDALRSLAHALRRLAADHPHAFPLMIGVDALFAPTLRIFHGGQAALRAAGFGEEDGAKAVNAAIGYAIGYAALERSCLAMAGTERLETIVPVGSLPAGLAPELARAAQDAAVAPDEQFAFGLEALLAGLAPPAAAPEP